LAALGEQISEFRTFPKVRYNCGMQNAFHHAIDLVFTMGLAMLGRSIIQNSQAISQSFSGFFNFRSGSKTAISPESARRLGSLCLTCGILAGIAYLVIIPVDMLLAN
jgi:hypothetical protein